MCPLFIFDDRHAEKVRRLLVRGSSHDVEEVSDELRGLGICRDAVCSGKCRR